MRVDTHTHLLLTKESAPDWKAIKFYFDIAKASGLDALCFTEHLDAAYYPELIDSIFYKNYLGGEILKEGVVKLTNSLIVTSGAEVSLQGGADIGVHTGPRVLKSLNRKKGYYTIDTLVDAVGSLTDEYIIVAHHLYRPGKWIKNIEEKSHLLDSIELPAKDISQKNKYESLGENLKKPFVAGSDAHTWIQIGVGQTIVDEQNNNEYFDISNFKQAIKKNMVATQLSQESERIVNMSRMYRNYLVS